MRFIGRLVVALLVLLALPAHMIVPTLFITSFTNPYIYDLLSGADPLITSYADAGLVPAALLAVSSPLLIVAFVQTLFHRGQPALLVLLAAILDAGSLYAANTLGYTSLGLSPLQIAMLGAGIIVLWLLVRAVQPKR
ncbi:MAG: hypothetical protein AAGI89_03565 [Pseudomonadota bacterium]